MIINHYIIFLILFDQVIFPLSPLIIMLYLVVILYLLLILNGNSLNTNKILKKQFRSPNVGKEYGLNFEIGVQSIGFQAGYRNSFFANQNELKDVYITSEKKSAEFDAFVTGGKHCFDKFCDSFLISHISSLPQSEIHSAIIEVKLNYGLLKDWVKTNNEGNKYLFFNPNAAQIYTKILVLNGGIESENFVKNLSSDEDIAHFKEVKDIILKANVNVFYKPWASGEVFSDLLYKVELLTEENSLTQKNFELISEENKLISEENRQIKVQLDFLLNEIKEMKKRS